MYNFKGGYTYNLSGKLREARKGTPVFRTIDAERVRGGEEAEDATKTPGLSQMCPVL